MKTARFGILFFPLLFLSCLGPDAAKSKKEDPWQGPFFFIQLADPQFGMFSGNKGFSRETELFIRAIEHANRLQPAFVVICGDLIHKPSDSAQTMELLRIIGMLDKNIPIHLLAGNHDIGNVPTPENLAWYRETIGPDRYLFHSHGCRFLVLNSTIIHRPDLVAGEVEEQWKWLQGIPKKTDTAHTFVFQHHPLFLKEPAEKDQYFNIPTWQRKKYLNSFQALGVTAVFAGHYHRNSYGIAGKMEMVTSGPVGKPLGRDPSGLRVVKVYKDRIEHKYYGMDQVPSQISLR